MVLIGVFIFISVAPGIYSLVTSRIRQNNSVEYYGRVQSIVSPSLKTPMPAKPIPEGFHTITPYLFAEGAPGLIEFISKAFHGEVIYRKERSDGSVMHATMRIGDSMLMLAEATSEFAPMATSVYLYVLDCDTAYRQALEAGGVSVFDIMTLPFGRTIRRCEGSMWKHLVGCYPRRRLIA
jgi:uncharacterized glyoxalase superfamily protein PhnB